MINNANVLPVSALSSSLSGRQLELIEAGMARIELEWSGESGESREEPEEGQNRVYSPSGEFSDNNQADRRRKGAFPGQERASESLSLIGQQEGESLVVG